MSVFRKRWLWRQLVILGLLGIAAGCCFETLGGCTEQCRVAGAFASIEKRTITPRNPAEWIYPAELSSVAACFITGRPWVSNVMGSEFLRLTAGKLSKSFSILRYGPGALPMATDGSNRDLLLTRDGHRWPSEVYFRCEEPLLYSARYRIKPVSIDENHTLVSIEAEATVELYKKFDPANLHQFRSQVISEIPSEGIDEYAILRTIGECLGVADQMPPLHLPEGPLGPCPECPQGLVGD